MPVPPAFSQEPFASWSIGGPLFKHELPTVVAGIPLHDIAFLIEQRGFPRPVKCADGVPPHWHRRRVVAWVWGLHTSPRLAEQTEFLLGYRMPGWAAPAPRQPVRGGPSRVEA